MKTRHNNLAMRWGLAAILAIGGGCGAPPAATGDEEPVSATATASTNASPAAAGEVGTPVKRAERVARTLPKDVAKVVDLVQSGVGEEVVRAYVATAPEAYRLDLDDVLYLRDIGVPDGVVAAMMRRGNELQEQAAAAANVQTNFVTAVKEIKDAIATEVAAEVQANAAAAATNAIPPGFAPPAESGPAPEAPPAPAPTAVAPTAPPAQAPVAVQQFYSDLAPYGSWYEVPTYGWVWQPAVVTVNPGWAPYCHGGSWTWSNYGWYWNSAYSWGWAPFHYGRWCTYPGLGWCWAPGTVWGPSWVTWSYTGGCVGWAPLPPACGWTAGVGLTWYGSGVAVGFGFGLASSCYTYVPYGNFCHGNYGHHRVPPGQVPEIHKNATVVNNIINGDNNTIVNNGVGYQTIASRTRNEIPKVKVEPLPAESNRSLRVDRVERAKEGNIVYKPTPIETPNSARPALRTEVQPVGSRSATTVASLAASPSRPGIGSRFATDTATTAAKPMESRAGAPTAVTGSGTPSSSTSAYRSPSPAAPAGVGNSPKTIEGRSVASYPTSTRPSMNTPSASSSVPTTGSRGSVQSQSSPASSVPSSRGLTTSTRVLSSPSAPTARPAPESRTAPTATPVPSAMPRTAIPSSSTTYPRASSSGSAPKTFESSRTSPYNVPARSSSTYSTPAPAASAPRATYTAPSPTMSTPRSTYTAPSAVMSAPRATYSTPSPSYSAPRATYSTPSPTYSAPRATYSTPSPSYSAPSPSMSAPRATYTAPSPSMSTPSRTFSAPSPAMSAPRAPYSAPSPASAPSPSGGSRGGGSRGQIN